MGVDNCIFAVILYRYITNHHKMKQSKITKVRRGRCINCGDMCGKHYCDMACYHESINKLGAFGALSHSMNMMMKKLEEIKNMPTSKLSNILK